MPPLIIAVAVAAIVVGTIAAAQSGAPLWSVFLLGPFAGIFAPKPGALNFGVSGANQGSPRYGTFGPLNNTVSNELVVPVLYGQVLVAGNLIWQSDPGNTVQQIIGLSEGQINSITGVKANNKDITGLTGCSVTPYYGTATQTADSI